AIDNSRLFLSLIQKNKQLLDATEQLQRRVRNLELLFELERSTARATSIEVLATAVLGTLARACEARGAALLLAEEETGDLVLYVYDNDHPDSLKRMGVKAGEGLLAMAMTSSETTRFVAGEGDGRLSERIEGGFPFPVHSALATPLEGDERAIGALGLFSKRGSQAFTEEDASL